jgi:hypothetical protein
MIASKWWSTSYATGPMRFLHASGAPWWRAAYLLLSAIRLRASCLDEGAEALVVLAAGGAALEVRAQPGDPFVCRLPLQLELDVLVEALEALVAKNLRLARSEQPLEGVVVRLPVHDLLR